MQAPLIALSAGMALLLAGCSPQARSPDGAPGVPRSEALAEVERAPAPTIVHEPEPPPEALVAEATVPKVKVYGSPGGSKAFANLENPDRYGYTRVFLVEEERGSWLKAYLPMRPNGSQGWIRKGDVTLGVTPYRVRVNVSANRLTVWKGEERVLRRTVAVGTGGTPTPTGKFYISMRVKPSDPGGVYGPFAFGLSAFSEVLFDFGGGEGQVAIHGTNNPSSIGQRASMGCIRLDNESIRKLRRLLPAGTPVTIVP